MKNAPHLRFAALFGNLLLLPFFSVGALGAGGGAGQMEGTRWIRMGEGLCCVAPAPARPEWRYEAPGLSRAGWVTRLQRRSANNAHHLQLKPDYHILPTGLADRPDLRRRRGSAYALAGLGATYVLAPGLRATTNWATGVGRYSVVPGTQFTLGVALNY